MNFNRSTYIALVLICTVLVVAGFYTYRSMEEKSYIESDFGQMATDKTGSSYLYTTLDGTEIRIGSYKGSYLVVNSWATWMPFSSSELQMIGQVAIDYQDRVSFLAINRGESKDRVAGYANRFNITDQPLILLDAQDSFYNSIDGFTMPETVVYDAEGTIFYRSRGPMKEEVLRDTLDTLLRSQNE